MNEESKTNQPTHWMDALTEREQKEVMFARMYAEDFGHGTDGHSRLMVIAKLAEQLDTYQNQK